jgi:hypothetical protein
VKVYLGRPTMRRIPLASLRGAGGRVGIDLLYHRGRQLIHLRQER